MKVFQHKQTQWMCMSGGCKEWSYIDLIMLVSSVFAMFAFSCFSCIWLELAIITKTNQPILPGSVQLPKVFPEMTRSDPAFVGGSASCSAVGPIPYWAAQKDVSFLGVSQVDGPPEKGEKSSRVPFCCFFSIVGLWDMGFDFYPLRREHFWRFYGKSDLSC